MNLSLNGSLLSRWSIKRSSWIDRKIELSCFESSCIWGKQPQAGLLNYPHTKRYVAFVSAHSTWIKARDNFGEWSTTRRCEEQKVWGCLWLLIDTLIDHQYFLDKCNMLSEREFYHIWNDKTSFSWLVRFTVTCNYYYYYYHHYCKQWSIHNHTSFSDKYYNLQCMKYVTTTVTHSIKSSTTLSTGGHKLWKRKCLLKKESVNSRTWID